MSASVYELAHRQEQRLEQARRRWARNLPTELLELWKIFDDNRAGSLTRPQWDRLARSIDWDIFDNRRQAAAAAVAELNQRTAPDVPRNVFSALAEAVTGPRPRADGGVRHRQPAISIGGLELTGRELLAVAAAVAIVLIAR